jgi:hypothetical protein
MKRINTAEQLDAALRGGNVSDPEIKGLVNAARRLDVLRPVPPLFSSEVEVARLAFLQQAGRIRSQQATATRYHEKIGWVNQLKNLLRPTKGRVFAPIMALLVVIILVSLGLGIQRSVRVSLPGDRLYSFKLASEDLQSKFTLGQFNRVAFYLDLAVKRNEEISKLARTNQPIPYETVAAFEHSLNAALLAASQLPDDELQSALQQIAQVSSSAGDYIVHARTWVQDERTQAALSQAASSAFNANNMASMGISDPQVFRMNMGAPNTYQYPTPTSTSGVVYLPDEPTPIVMQPTATQVMMMPPAVQPSPTATLSSQVPVSASKTPTEGIPSQPPTKTEAAPVLPTPTVIILPPTQVAPTVTPTATPTPSEPLQPPTPTLIQQGVEN